MFLCETVRDDLIYVLENLGFNTHEIDIVKFYGEKLDVCYTIASFNEAGEIVSCGNRLLDGVTAEDIEAIKTLADIAYLIISKTEVVAAE